MIDQLLDEFSQRHGLDPETTAALGGLVASVLGASWVSGTLVPGVIGEDEPDSELGAVTVVVARSLEGEPAPAASAEGFDSATHASRYLDLGLIGMGGMGEVRRVRDLELNRVVAMKILRPEVGRMPHVVARFVEEAQATAQLEHPSIVPVHELGRLPDGRLYFTMKKVRGRTLSSVIHEVHAASIQDWAPGPSGWSFRRLVDAFHRVCEAVGFAHDRMVVHRDLKPANVMVGGYGEVLVLDWGLAKLLGMPRDLRLDHTVPVDGVSIPLEAGAGATVAGSVYGTPNYMPPEQARGDPDAIGAPSDVYALGSILYELLCGRRPYAGLEAFEAIHAVVSGPPDPVDPPHPVPTELLDVCARAMQREPEDRYPNAREMAADLGAWLEGSRRREAALASIARADDLGPAIQELLDRAGSLRRRAADVLDALPAWAPVEQKRPGWQLQDEADALEHEAELREGDRTQHLYAALTHAPGLAEAHERLALYFRDLHAEAEGSHELRAAARLEALLRTHVDELDPDSAARGDLAGYLAGDGRLILRTDPLGARAEVFRYVRVDRRLVPERVQDLGRTPVDVTLPIGSYLVKLRAPGRLDVAYPVRVSRQGAWSGVRPGSPVTWPIHLPHSGEIGADDVYVPGGWYTCGGDRQASGALARRQVWVDAFVIRRFGVTHGAYLEFLDDLWARGRRDDVHRYVPRGGVASMGTVGEPLYELGPDGYRLPADRGAVVLPDQPVVGVDFHCATAYSRWMADRDGVPWRLPTELEWEKASRGVDGRFFPWGDELDPTWCCMRDSHRGRPSPAVVDSFPIDESPYGVRGMAGNSFDWCGDTFELDGPPLEHGCALPAIPLEADPFAPRVTRGGGWDSPPRFVRVASRIRCDPLLRADDVGFRLARSLSED